MRARRVSLEVALLAAVLGALDGCGQTGALYYDEAPPADQLPPSSKAPPTSVAQPLVTPTEEKKDKQAR